MVHIEYTSVACRAVMAAFWLKNVAHQAVTASFVFRIAQVKAPKHWDLSRVGCHCLDEGPDKQYEKHVKGHEQNVYRWVFYRKLD